MQPHVVRPPAVAADPVEGRAGATVTTHQAPARSDVRRVRCVGELDMVTVPAVQPALIDACRTVGGRAGARLELDLSGIGFCGARGLSMLLALAEEAESLEVDLLLVSPSRAVRRLLTLTGTSGYFPAS